MMPPRERVLATGPAYDCATCLAWQAGTVVLRGSTQGRCATFETPVGADFGCDHHTALPAAAPEAGGE